MATLKTQAVHVEALNSRTVSPEHVQHHVSEIDQGNQAVLLRVEDDTREKGQAGYLRLAKDHHVWHWTQQYFIGVN